MKVLGIDPGFDRVGVAILEGDASKPSVLFSTCLKTNKLDKHPDRIKSIVNELSEIIKKHSPEFSAVETLFFSKNTKTAIAVAEARGAILATLSNNNLPIIEVSPQEVKVAATGYGKSEKEDVIRMIKHTVKDAPEKALDDEYDAIAIAITGMTMRKSKVL